MLTLSIFAIMCAAVLTTVFARHQPSSPLFWLTPFALFYAVSYSLSEVVDTGSYNVMTGSLILMNVVGFVAALSAAWLANRVPSPFVKANSAPRVFDTRPFAFETQLFYVVCLVCCFSFVVAIQSGFVNKREVADTMFSATSVLPRIWVLFLVMSVRQLLLCASAGKLFNTHLLVSIAISVFAWLMLGQREHLFGIGLVWLLIGMYRIPSQFRTPLLWGAILAFSFVEPTTQNLKSTLIGGNTKNLRETTLLYPTPYAGTTRNIMIIKDAEVEITTTEVIRRELIRPFNAFGRGAQVMSMSQWYNDVVRARLGIEGSSGWGFSLIGSGWLAGRYLGIAGLFILFGTVIGGLYRLSHRSLFWGSIYGYIIPLSIYVLRQDLSYFINSVIKHALIPMLILALINSVMRPPTDRIR